MGGAEYHPGKPLAEVTVSVFKEGEGTVFARTKRVIQINAGKEETARLSLTLAQPLLWDAEHPELYRVKAEAVSLGVYRTHFVKEEITETDEAEVLFGIRTITAGCHPRSSDQRKNGQTERRLSAS